MNPKDQLLELYYQRIKSMEKHINELQEKLKLHTNPKFLK